MKTFLALGLGLGLSGSLFAAEQKATIKVYGMTCQMCANGVAGSVKNLKGVKSAEVSVKEGQAVVVYDNAQVTVEQIKVVVHPEAIIHSMVEFTDGSIIAQLSITDMRLPIQYALTYPQRWQTGLDAVDFLNIKTLTFQRPDLERFPALSLATQVGRKGGTFPSVLNAADEEAVGAFLEGKLKFTDIYNVVESVVRKHKSIAPSNLKAIYDADLWAREQAKSLISRKAK